MPTTALYRIATNLAVPLVSRFLGDDNGRRAHAARLEAPHLLREWATANRDPERRLVWLHAASVGEGLQARAVARALRSILPDAQLVFTHFSPSAERLAETVPADHRGYLPYDRLTDVSVALRALQPDLLVFSKLDLWPELAATAAGSGVKVAMIAATVDPESSRLRWRSRIFTRRGYQSLSMAGAISTDDAQRLVLLGADPNRIDVTGDPRVDSVLDALTGPDTGPPLPPIGDGHRMMIAGSTWPEDEAVLLEAFAKVRAVEPAARLVIVPHQPTAEHLASLDATADWHHLPTPVPWDHPAAADAPLLVVPAMGVLARLYGAGSSAYVGGGLGTRGIHSVLEPAALARPILIGPNDRGVRDASMLAAAGALHRLESVEPARDLANQWLKWLRSPRTAAAAGAAGLAALSGDRGAAQRSAELLVGLLDGGSATD